jgi:E3 ubiquitin-protein ligase RFWD2
VWSVDFCTAAPSLLASGGDDGHVKVFCTRSRRAALDLDLRANVCCVRYDPTCAHTLAVGSADHGVHLYDARAPRAPLHVFAGHAKAVSHVAFLPGGELVSASTDSSLRVWDVARRAGVRTLVGHANDKNFVGLSVRDDFVACGSEDNTAFVYHRAATRPVARHSFASPPPASESDAGEPRPAQPFVSAVCWKRDAPVLLAANSDGVLRVLALAG